MSIKEDTKRLKEFVDLVYDVQKHNKRDEDYNDSRDQRPLPKMKPLKDIFGEVQLKLDGASR